MTESTCRIAGATGAGEVVVGLAVHAKVTSNAKLISRALPVPNRECIRQAQRTGMAIEARAGFTGRAKRAW